MSHEKGALGSGHDILDKIGAKTGKALTMESEEKNNALDEAILHEKMRAAREMQTEIWTDGLLEGIERDILADAAIATALEEIVDCDGEDAALAVIDDLRDRVVAGEFTRLRVLQ